MDMSERAQLSGAPNSSAYVPSPSLSTVEACRDELTESCSQPQPFLIALPDSGFYSPGGEIDLPDRFDFVNRNAATFTSAPILTTTTLNEGCSDFSRMKLDMSRGQLFRRRKRSLSQPPMVQHGLGIFLQGNRSSHVGRSQSVANIHSVVRDEWHVDGTSINIGSMIEESSATDAAANLDPQRNYAGQSIFGRDGAIPLEEPGELLSAEALDAARLLGMRLRIVADEMEEDLRSNYLSGWEMERLEQLIMDFVNDFDVCRLS